MNKKKKKCGDNDFNYLYNIITTNQDWHFLLYSPRKIFKANDTANLIKFFRKASEPNSRSYQLLCNSMKEVLSVIVGLLIDKNLGENAELKQENSVIPNLKNNLLVLNAKIAELKHKNTEALKANEKYNEKCDVKIKKLEQNNAELKAKIKELKKNNTKENAELKNRLMKVE
ncbi:hypothetical protein GLOIN_2v1695250 [Rhizophagus clarus]|uniref:Uncharacterized protein n=1 Tax=Rhizophagus clarus TaxID=94130 RepID=A0A8H3M1K3_9GLOM|nr:hypothetical protein GLOIN_2v1695250 [Rhizophagus clarus]